MLKLIEALIGARKEIAQPEKKGKSNFGNCFRIEDVLSAIEKPCLENNILFFQYVETNGEKMFVKTKITHISGEALELEFPIILEKQNMQGLGSAVTYAKKYALISFFGLGDYDDDGEISQDTHKQNVFKKEADSEIEYRVRQKMLSKFSGLKDREELTNACMAFILEVTNKRVPLNQLSKVELIHLEKFL